MPFFLGRRGTRAQEDRRGKSGGKAMKHERGV
jgi:hypothetical protein